MGCKSFEFWIYPFHAFYGSSKLPTFFSLMFLPLTIPEINIVGINIGAKLADAPHISQKKACTSNNKIRVYLVAYFLKSMWKLHCLINGFLQKCGPFYSDRDHTFAEALSWQWNFHIDLQMFATSLHLL